MILSIRAASLLAGAGALSVAGIAAAIARADDVPCKTRLDHVPAHQEWVERNVEIAAVTECRNVPTFETVKVPLYEERRVPTTREVEVPVYATREVPVFEERQVPVTGPVTVQDFKTVEEPVGIHFTNPFNCCPVDLKLWDRCTRVPCGSHVEQGVVGFRTEQVPCGTRTETFVSGTEKRVVSDGERCEVVKVGERDEARQTGWRTDTVVVTPARTETVRECLQVPAQDVTVVEQGDPNRAAPMAGTTRVMSEDDFRRACALAR
jgi:hypothetical protein